MGRVEEEYQALAILGAGVQTVPHINHLFSAVTSTRLGGEIVDVDSLWTPPDARRIVLTSPSGATIKTGVLDEAAGLDLAAVESARWAALPGDQLNHRELTLRRLIRGRRPGTEESILNRLADALCLMGGIAVLGGTQQGVSTAASKYYDLQQSP